VFEPADGYQSSSNFGSRCLGAETQSGRHNCELAVHHPAGTDQTKKTLSVLSTLKDY
jgi:hypothetical protein